MPLGEGRDCYWKSKAEKENKQAGAVVHSSWESWGTEQSSSLLQAPAMARDAAVPAATANSTAPQLPNPMPWLLPWMEKKPLGIEILPNGQALGPYQAGFMELICSILTLEKSSCFHCRSFWLCLCRSKENCPLTSSCEACSVMRYI